MVDQKRPKLLLVEDDLGLQRQLAWTFEDFEVFRAKDRSTAQDVLAKEKPSVILLDLGLPPDADGPSAERLARQQSYHDERPDGARVRPQGRGTRRL